MPRINLLPVKAARRVDSARNELIAVAGLLLATTGGVYYWHTSTEYDIGVVQEHLEAVRSSITETEKTLQRVEEFKNKARTLEQKLEVIDKLRRQKVGPAKMLEDLSAILTLQPKVWISNFQEKDGLITLEGGAMSHENISEFQLALERESKFFKSIHLTYVNTTKEGDVSYLLWALTCVANYSAG